MGETLKPCPFCGGEAKYRTIGNAHTKSRATEIGCNSCFFKKRVGAIRHSLEWTQERAIEAWNRRAATHEEVERLTTALQEITNVSAGGPHTSAEEAVKANWGALMRCRELARAALQQGGGE